MKTAVIAATALVAAPLGASAATTTGTYTLNLTVKATTPVACASNISCTVNLEVLPDSDPPFAETATRTAVAGNPGLYACTLKIPYGWPLTTPSGSVGVNFDVTLTGTTTTRSSLSIPLATFAIPANGGSTTQNGYIVM